MKNKMKVVDLFSGCGGFSQGFHLAGFEIICAIDHWAPARDSILMNHGEKALNKKFAEKYNYDVEIISKLHDEEFHKVIPDSEIIIGSPPCVSFSNSNRSGYANKDLGIRLIESFLRIVARKKNKKNSILKYWIMENVPKSEKFVKDEYTFKGFENGYEGQIKPVTIKDVKGKNSRVYNSSEYGVPSKRLRYICGDFEEPKRITRDDEELHLRTILKKLEIKKGAKKIQDPVWPDCEISKNELTDHGYNQEIPEWQWQKAKRQKRDKGYMGQMAFPENMNKVARTVMSFAAIASREGFILPNGKTGYRHPTIREYATLMSFPFNFQFSGRTPAHKKKQIGNAVPPKFSYELAIAIKKNKLALKKLLKTKVATVDNFLDIKDYDFKTPIEKEKRFKVIFDHHIPYMKIGGYRVVLDNRESNWEAKKIKWNVSIHKGSGNFKVLKPNLNEIEKDFKLSKSNHKKIDVLKKNKGTALTLHNNYRLPNSEREKNNIIGPEELLQEIKNNLITPKFEKKIKNFRDIEKHDKNQYNTIAYLHDKIKYEIPKPILLGYFILNTILKG
jgi:DNA (cytosine-5)-methyltransferase 1